MTPKEALLQKLNKIDECNHVFFKSMYNHTGNDDATIEEVVDHLDDDEVTVALTQVQAAIDTE